MLEKFRKKFGDNANPVSEGVSELRIPEKVGDTLDHNRELALRNRHRAIGALAFILLLAVVLPWVFEPNIVYSDKGAKTEIPPLAEQTSVQRLTVTPKKPAASEVTTVDRMKKTEAVAKALAKPNVVPIQTTQPGKVSTQTSQITKTASAKPEAKTSSPDVMGAKIKHLEKDSTAPKKPAEVTVITKGKVASIKSPADEPLKTSANGRYFIQVIATSNRASAEVRAKKVRQLGLPVYVESVRRRNADLWRVRVGRFDSQAEAKKATAVLRKHAIDNGGVMVEKPVKNKSKQ